MFKTSKHIFPRTETFGLWALLSSFFKLKYREFLPKIIIHTNTMIVIYNCERVFYIYFKLLKVQE